jgi:hypothetical protein
MLRWAQQELEDARLFTDEHGFWLDEDKTPLSRTRGQSGSEVKVHRTKCPKAPRNEQLMVFGGISMSYKHP